tara:strand:- start:105 stop:1256 length:1152 start_codon:yes stop_codon:yes gene_type:complete
MAQVGNKNIDNASGQVVRLDIQNTLAAVATNNFGARNSGGTILPCEFLADDTTNKLLIRKSSGGDQANPNPSSGTAAVFFEVGNLDEDNLGLMKKSGAAMTGQLLADDGSGAGSPAYAFDGDGDTGMFRASANRIGFATAGVNRVVITDTGIVTQNGSEILLEDTGASNTIAIKPPALTSDISLTLPSSITNGGFLQTDGSGNLSFQIVAGVPTGAVFCVAVATIPTGYLECNGAAVSRTTYAALFSFIGTQYGAGNGSSTFNLPDLRGEFVRGFDNGRGVDSGRAIGSSQSGQNLAHDHDADASATSNVSDPGHRHNARGYGGDDDGGDQFAGSGNNSVRNNAIEDATTGISVATNVSIDVDDDGGNEARPRNIAMMYVIKI